MTGNAVKDAIVKSLQDGYVTRIATVDGEKYKIDNYSEINDDFCIIMDNNKIFTIDTKSMFLSLKVMFQAIQVLRKHKLNSIKILEGFNALILFS